MYYQYGFNEAGGNFQVNNYGRGGLGNDGLSRCAQFGRRCRRINNAFMATPPDGMQPLIAMFEFTSRLPIVTATWRA